MPIFNLKSTVTRVPAMLALAAALLLGACGSSAPGAGGAVGLAGYAFAIG
jgi:hypothetical protein